MCQWTHQATPPCSGVLAKGGAQSWNKLQFPGGEGQGPTLILDFQSWGANQDAELKTALGFQVPETQAMKKPAALKKNLQAEPPEATLPKDEHP